MLQVSDRPQVDSERLIASVNALRTPTSTFTHPRVVYESSALEEAGPPPRVGDFPRFYHVGRSLRTKVHRGRRGDGTGDVRCLRSRDGPSWEGRRRPGPGRQATSSALTCVDASRRPFHVRPPPQHPARRSARTRGEHVGW